MSEQVHSGRRYKSPMMSELLHQLDSCSKTQEVAKIKQVKKNRQMSYSFSTGHTRNSEIQRRPLFNNKTKDHRGSLIEEGVKSVPYVFIPKYKNDTFIMPDRVFAKGDAGKRLHVTMKDSAIYSFNGPEKPSQSKAVQRESKEKTILSRKLEEFSRILDVDDGNKRATKNRFFLKHQRVFNYTDAPKQFFSQSEPMMGPRDQQGSTTKKTSLVRTFDFNNRWRPNSRKSSLFNATQQTNGIEKRSVMSHKPHTSSLL